MSTGRLLRELETLTHDDRMRRMVELGRRAAMESDVAATLAALEQGDIYQRRLALQSCFGSGDGAHVLRALRDPSRAVRGLAVRLVPLACNHVEMQSALDMVPSTVRPRLVGSLHKRHRRAVIDEYLTSLSDRGEEELGRLLHFGSPEMVQQHLQRVLPRAGADDWRRLARFHPDLIADALERQLGTAKDPDHRLIRLANAVLADLTDRRPERVLALVPILMGHGSLARLDLQRLARRRPRDLADLLLTSDDRAQVRLDAVAHRLDADRLVRLAGHDGDAIAAVRRWFLRLPPVERARVYEAIGRGWRDAEGKLPESLVARLPRRWREVEGRRHLALPALATRPEQRLPWAAFLPWDEARTVLDPFVRNPEAELRAAALGALVYSVRFERGRLPELLTLIRARRNEQDPVRYALLNGLADLPPGIWRPEHLDDLGQIIREALDAADLAVTTAGAAEQLIVRLLPFQPAWCSQWLATLVRERGQVHFYDLGERLSDADVRRIAPDLLPVLQAWQTREREVHLVAAAQSLGRRLGVFDGLVEILETVLRETRSPWTARTILGVLTRHRRERIAALIPRLVAEDPSWITQPDVYTYLHRRRQDLLTSFLGQHAYKGRFSTGKTRFVLPLRDGFQRWTAAQQTVFARTLGQLVADDERDSPALFTAIDQLAALPAVPPVRLMQLASPLTSKAAVRDAALRALGRLDADQGVATLLEALGDDRARIAMYALRRVLLAMPADRALELLRSAPFERVSVAKEIVRLLGELRTAEGYGELLALEGRELHRDVRIALLRALWDHLERPSTWPILERAATSPDPALAAIVGRIPADRRSPEVRRRLAALLAMLLEHSDPKVRLDILRRCHTWPVTDAERILLPRFLGAMASPFPDESAAAAGAVFSTYAGADAPVIGAAIEALLPNRRAIKAAVQTLQQTAAWSRQQMLPMVEAVLDALAGDPLTARLRVTLAAHFLPAESLTRLLTRLTTTGELYADTLSATVDTVGGHTRWSSAADRAQLEKALATSPDERLRRVAVAALVAQALAPNGWDETRLARLRAYREDPAPLVAAAAQFILPSEEVGAV